MNFLLLGAGTTEIRHRYLCSSFYYRQFDGSDTRESNDFCQAAFWFPLGNHG
jgi:hypothetical protein